MVLQYYAHVRENANGNKEYQTVAQHLAGTAELCRGFAAAFGAEADGELAGLTHDIGKCTEEFQNRLLNDGPTLTTPQREQWPAPCGEIPMFPPAWRDITAVCRILAI